MAEQRKKPVQRGTDLDADDRTEVPEHAKDAVWAAAKVRPHRPKLRLWHRDRWRR